MEIVKTGKPPTWACSGTPLLTLSGTKKRFKVLSWIKLWSVFTSIQLDACTKHPQAGTAKWAALPGSCGCHWPAGTANWTYLSAFVMVMEEKFGRMTTCK